MPPPAAYMESYDQILDLRERTVKLLAELGDPQRVQPLNPHQVKSLLEGYVAGLRSIHGDCLSEKKSSPVPGSPKYFLFRATQEALAWVVDSPSSPSLEKTQKDLARALSDIEWYMAQFPKRRDT